MGQQSDRKPLCSEKLAKSHNVPDRKNTINPALVEKTKIFLPPLPIKLGLTKNFVKGMDKEGGFAYLKTKIPSSE
jgi:hypothetical protein